MKIIIVGAGIGGLATYQALQKHIQIPNLSIKIVERRKSSTESSTTYSSGGGLGLAPNGLRAIESLSPSAVAYIRERAFDGAMVTFRNSTGRSLGKFSLGRKERYNGFGQLMVPRAVVHDALLSDIKDSIEWGKGVKDISEIKDGDVDGPGVLVQYEDGTSESANLVIGADGVRSRVQEFLFKGEYSAKYDGLTGVGGFIPLSSLSPDLRNSFQTEGITMTFGQQGFFGYSMCSPLSSAFSDKPFMQWWSIYEDPTPPQRNEYKDQVKAQLLSRHGNWKSPFDSADETVYNQIIELGCRTWDKEFQEGLGVDLELLVLPRYVTPRLPRWSNATSSTPASSRGRIILLGDAAHTMPPDSGQGVSCAIEDAVVYALLLKHYLAERDLTQASALTETSVLEKTAQAYEKLRMPRVNKILDLAKRNGDAKRKLGWWGQTFRDLVMRIICMLPESINDAYFGYDAQKAAEDFIGKL